jgi:hypothetical protein
LKGRGKAAGNQKLFEALGHHSAFKRPYLQPHFDGFLYLGNRSNNQWYIVRGVAAEKIKRLS